MKNNNALFYPGWAEHHVPARGSERPYTPCTDFDDSFVPSSVAPTAEGQLAQVHDREQRMLRRLERLAS